MRVRRLWQLAERHPVPAVAVLSTVALVIDVLWVRGNRPLGGWNVDEAGFITSSLSVHRSLAEFRLSDAWRTASGSTTGPLVPVLGALAAVAERSAWAVAVVPAVARAALAVAVAGLVKTLGGGPNRVLVAGSVAVGWPAAVLAGRSVQPATLTALALVVAVWALVASEGARRLSAMAVMGGAVGLAVLARPMAVAFVPGLALATLVVSPRNRPRLVGLVVAVAVAAAVTLPWLLSAGQVRGYLAEYGFGDTAGSYGPSGLLVRVFVRGLMVLGDVRLALLLAGVGALVAVRRGRRAVDDQRMSREVAAVWAVVGSGGLALMMTSNLGTWFELPLEMLAVAGLAMVAGAVAEPRRWTAVVLAVAVLNVGLIGRLGPGDDVLLARDDDRASVGALLFADQHRAWVITHIDPAIGADPGDRERVAARWWASAHAVVDAARTATGSEGVDLAVAGSSPTLSLNVLRMARELPIGPSGDDGRLDRGAGLADLAGDVPALVVIDTRAEPFPGEVSAPEARAMARSSGWVLVATIPLPDGGRAEVWKAAA